MARYLQAQPIHPDLVLCSPARRTRETLDIMAASLGPGIETVFDEDLYGAGAAWLLARLRALPSATGSAMLVGHNPGIHELALMVTGGPDPAPSAQNPAQNPAEKLAEKYPTGALTILQITGGWADLGRAPATILAFVTPKDL